MAGKLKRGDCGTDLEKGGREKVEDHRGVTIMSASYKIYVTILAERLRKEVQERGIITAEPNRF